MKIALLIPTRGDRPALLDNCLRMMKAQILPEGWTVHIELVDDKPVNNGKDITWRYRTGYDRLRGKGYNIIALIEDDDWYSPDYLRTMVLQWLTHGSPDLFGTDYTIYYHLKLKARFTMEHPARSSAMNTLIKPDLDFAWCPDNEPYTDLHLWFKALKGKIWHPPVHISLGIKHGIGLCGGHNHTSRMERFINPDPETVFLGAVMDKESFEFYTALIK